MSREFETDLNNINHVEFLQKLNSANFDLVALNNIIPLQNMFSPGLDLQTQFAKGEKHENKSLSGGERSVVSICLAACCKQAGIVCIDEIN